jgi:hypothetical protein
LEKIRTPTKNFINFPLHKGILHSIPSQIQEVRPLQRLQFNPVTIEEVHHRSTIAKDLHLMVVRKVEKAKTTHGVYKKARVLVLTTLSTMLPSI